MKTPFDQFRDLANELTKELSKEMKKFQDKEGPRSAPRSSGEAELNRHIRGAEKKRCRSNVSSNVKRRSLMSWRQNVMTPN
ncbi:hypothetical protein [Exiguobacterium mexicanum]|uniref:hypothetical protein n=1 Tax=Exiguobacterium mexicanum TaxID=340146 RepID=UPI0037C02FF0